MKRKEKNEDYTSQFGGSFTPQDFEQYRIYINEQADNDIRMYFEFHINKKSYRRVAAEFGVSKSQVVTRLNKLIGRMNAMRTTST